MYLRRLLKVWKVLSLSLDRSAGGLSWKALTLLLTFLSADSYAQVCLPFQTDSPGKLSPDTVNFITFGYYLALLILFFLFISGSKKR